MSWSWIHLRRRYKVLIASVLAAAIVAGIAGYLYQKYSVERYSAVNGKLTVKTEAIDNLGKVLVTNKGYALYIFPPDGANRVSCTDDCAFAWPPLIVPDGGQVIAGNGVHSDLLGTMPNPDGKQVVTYNGWPLYTYLGDANSNHAKGQGVDADGGYWYVVRPSGRIVGD